MSNKLALIPVILSFLTATETAKRSFDVDFKKVTCNNYTLPIKYLYCDLRKLQVNRYSSDIIAILDRQLLDNAELRIQIHYSLPASRSKTIKFLDIKLNICNALDNLKAMPLVKTLFIELMRSSNVPYSCPIYGNINMTNFILTDEILPLYTPILSFNYTISVYENHKFIGYHLMEGSTEPRRTRKNRL